MGTGNGDGARVGPIATKVHGRTGLDFTYNPLLVYPKLRKKTVSKPWKLLTCCFFCFGSNYPYLEQLGP
jgi:hypothetical protein